MQMTPCDGPYSNYTVKSIVDGELEPTAACHAVIEEWTDSGVVGFDPIYPSDSEHPVEVSYCLLNHRPPPASD